MKYDFDRIRDRKNTDSAKWNMINSVFGGDDVIPMWVADMDFPAAQPVIDALKERAGHLFYGYVRPGPGVTEAVVERMRRKFNWKIEPEWVVYTPGVIPALHAAVRALARPGDSIILQEPVYFPFFSAVESSGCRIVNNELKLVDGRYEMDFDNLESTFKPQRGMLPGPSRVKAIILCNPQNPVGRLWNRDELLRMGEIIIRNGGVVVSDEIHCEILFGDYRHTPFAAISEEFRENSIVCMSPSKTFNLAGLEISTIIIPNEKLRNEFNNTRSGIQPGPNLFGYAALEAAYRSGDEWLEQVLGYLQANLDCMTAYFAEKIPRIKVIQPQGTYLIWLDCRELGMDNQSLSAFMREKAKVGMNDGYMFGESGSGFQRMNIACPRPLLEKALSRIEKAVNSL
jgi:cystathionine beta-lyase